MNKQKSRHNSKRIRIFAGPNGSGKSTLAENLKQHSDKRIKLGVFVNADEIEKALKKEGLLLSDYGIFDVSKKEITNYILHKGFSLKKDSYNNLDKKITIRANRLVVDEEISSSYLAADIAGFIRNRLLNDGKSFSFETVFSHHSKLDFVREAKKAGYKIYLYFITTDDVIININRVKIRVEQQGHDVPKEKIKNRYKKSLDLLFDTVKECYRAYLFDNSGKYYELIAEVTPDKTINITDYDKQLPNWFIKYVYEKVSHSF